MLIRIDNKNERVSIDTFYAIIDKLHPRKQQARVAVQVVALSIDLAKESQCMKERCPWLYE